MGMIARLREPEYRAAAQLLPPSLLTQPTASGTTVTEKNAVTNAAVYAAVNAIASTIGTLPLKVYQKQDRGRREATDHPLYVKLHDNPRANQSAMEWRALQQALLLLRGDAIAEIVRNQVGEVVDLIPLDPLEVEVEVSRRDGRRLYLVNTLDQSPYRLAQDSVFHVAGLGFDGCRGQSIITLARESIGLGLSMEQYAARFFGNGSQPRGILTTDETLPDEVQARLAKSWNDAHQGVQNSHKVAVLEAGLTWQQIGLTAEDSQFLQSRQFGVRDIARWFNIPPHKLRDLEDATFSNIEQQNIEYFTDTIQPWVTRWEQAATIQLLSARDRARGYYVEFNVDGILRGDSERRSAMYRELFQIGAITPNEIRARENLDPVEGGDTPFIRLDMIPLDRADEWADKQVADMGAGAEPGMPLLEAASRPMIAAETRAIDRLGVADEFRDLLTASGDRMVRREVTRIRRLMDSLLADDPAAFLDAVNIFYRQEWPAEVIAIMGPALRAYIAAVHRATASDLDIDPPDLDQFRDEYVNTFANRYSASSRRQIEQATARGADDLERKLMEWDEGYEDKPTRGAMTARRESSQALNAVSKAVFVAAGVTAYRWVTRSDSCPLCNELAGRVVRGANPFVATGTTVVGEDGRRIKASSNVGHPPLHDGCDCYVAPVIGGL